MDTATIIQGTNGIHVKIDPVTDKGAASEVFGVPTVIAAIDGKVAITLAADGLSFDVKDAGQALSPGTTEEVDINIHAEGDPAPGVDPLDTVLHIIIKHPEATSLKLEITDNP